MNPSFTYSHSTLHSRYFSEYSLCISLAHRAASFGQASRPSQAAHCPARVRYQDQGQLEPLCCHSPLRADWVRRRGSYYSTCVYTWQRKETKTTRIKQPRVMQRQKANNLKRVVFVFSSLCYFSPVVRFRNRLSSLVQMWRLCCSSI